MEEEEVLVKTVLTEDDQKDKGRAVDGRIFSSAFKKRSLRAPNWKLSTHFGSVARSFRVHLAKSLVRLSTLSKHSSGAERMYGSEIRYKN